MARNKGRRPPDASRATPDSRRAEAEVGAVPSGTANGAAALGAGATSHATVSGTAAAASGAAQSAFGPASAASEGPAPGTPAAAGASAAGSPPDRPATPPPSGTQSGRPATPPPASGGPGGRPPGSAGGSGAGRPPGASPPPREGARRSFTSGLIGGLIGGAVAALALVFFLRPNDSAELATLRAQIEQVQGSVASLEGGTDTVAALDSRLATLEQAAPAGDLQTRLETLEQASAAGPEELRARLEALEQGGPDLAGLAQRIETLESASASGGGGAETGQQLKQLQEELATLSANVAAQALGEGDSTASDLALLDTLQARLAALEESAPGADAGEALTALEGRVAQLESSQPDPARADEVKGQLDGLAQRVAALEPLGEQSAGQADTLNGLTGQLRGLDEQIQGLSERADAAKAELDTLSAKVTETDARVAAVTDDRQHGALLALVASQVDSALRQGQAYDVPLQGLGALAEDDAVKEASAALAPTAASGVPSLAELQRSFAPVASEIVHQSQAPEGGGLLGQAAGNLMRLVSVRPVGGDVEGDDPPARVARAEAALDKGDLAAAVAEVEALEGPAAAAADWLAQARARLAATAALDRLQSRAAELLAQGG